MLDPSKVSISSATMQAASYKGLTFKKRTELKRERVFAYIRLQPDHQATMSDLIAAAGYRPGEAKSYNAGFAFVKNMVNRGHIGHNGAKTFRKTWFITKDVDVVDGKIVWKENQSKVVSAAINLGQEIEKQKQTTDVPFLQQAKEFAWTHNSDSLREFVEWLEKTQGDTKNGDS